jgi:hypothetical protein
MWIRIMTRRGRWKKRRKREEKEKAREGKA